MRHLNRRINHVLRPIEIACDVKVCLLFSLLRFIVALSDVNLKKTACSFIYLLLKRAVLKQWLDVPQNLFIF